jgi:NTP pyrophosphatase (non-canonical NTP hydrolase)
MRDLSKQLSWFAGQMAKKLRENDHKGSWSELDNNYLTHRLHQEFVELTEAITKGTPDEIIAEATDVANFALMIADNANRKGHL